MLEHSNAFGCWSAATRRASARARPNPETCSVRPTPSAARGRKGAAGKARGAPELMLAFKVDDVIDWLWEHMQLPNLQARIGA